ncbi:sugar transferase [Salinirubellus salinus]|uniref:Sugar transferase n=1 Tax=Salinirubellus salinus TaxID=1364945 RepID=A0A9E7QZ80_9EURY|nr:sugar transferase [Salinirubellus salinus]UWM52754.1 sugar transferase [Salinirubellus salinus]
MRTGWQYRLAAGGGAIVLTTLAVLIAANGTVQSIVRLVPVLGRLPLEPSTGRLLFLETATAVAVMFVTFIPLFKSRPRRLLDTATLSQQRVLLAMVALAAIGYFDYTFALPRLTLVLTTAILLVAMPGWFMLIRTRPSGSADRVLIVGDDPETIAEIHEVTDVPVLGYVSPPITYTSRGILDIEATDGGTPEALSHLTNLGGLSRLDEVLVQYDIDTAVLAFSHPDRAEFFGALDSCYEHGVTAKVHRDHADAVLTTGFGEDELVDIDLEPWDPVDHVLKRAFDIAFAGVALLILSPVILVIAFAVKLEDGGSVLYRQERTASFGDTFTVAKFRSMIENAEENGAKLSEEDRGGVDPRVTRVGRVIRATHLDEIPQLWSILVGDMSVVGPRPERPELDWKMEDGASKWRSRWFVKPGLTGLAQIQGATGHDPEKKLRYDVEYIRRQNFWFDVKIVIRQVYMVVQDAVVALGGDSRHDE